VTQKIWLDEKTCTIVDDEDAERFSWFDWFLSSDKRYPYAVTNVSLHRLILMAPKNMIADHINGDTLDNRRSNLRLVTPQQSVYNTRGHNDSSSRFKGVSYEKSRGKWAAGITVNKVHLNLGRFDDEREAARAYDRAALIHHGEFAWVNFPEERT